MQSAPAPPTASTSPATTASPSASSTPAAAPTPAAPAATSSPAPAAPAAPSPDPAVHVMPDVAVTGDEVDHLPAHKVEHGQMGIVRVRMADGASAAAAAVKGGGRGWCGRIFFWPRLHEQVEGRGGKAGRDLVDAVLSSWFQCELKVEKQFEQYHSVFWRIGLLNICFFLKILII